MKTMTISPSKPKPKMQMFIRETSLFGIRRYQLWKVHDDNPAVTICLGKFYEFHHAMGYAKYYAYTCGFEFDYVGEGH